MKHAVTVIPALAACALVAFFVTTAPASAQAAPERTCSAEDIRQALAGDYAGPPCRFTDMPEGADLPLSRPASRPAPDRLSSPQLAGAPPVGPMTERRVVQPRQVEFRPTASGPDRGGIPVPMISQARPIVRLDDNFFSGGLTGGVGQVPTIQYGYRGIIVIDGAGRTSILPPGQVANAPVRRMQARGALRTQLVGQ